ncbi:FAD-binding oxidoreductase [Paenibacillus sp. GCM10023252]|uniref:FAD-binding oxidoreductase n=1 Tax=Paenibacillus sp. GCM10023252 TaxID=3252649 RepID=UPI003609BC18
MVWMKDITELFGEDKVLQDRASIEKLSKDYYWYSPVLESKLRDKVAEAVVQPVTEEEVAQVLSFAYKHRIPITTRGAGTGNYGQAVPLQGGIVLDLSGMNRIIELRDGLARVQCGVKLGVLERTARERGQELRIYPSTYVKATVGGFISGGSGGIGSITWGNLWDGNVLEAVIYTMEEEPQRLVVTGEELFNYIHSYGTTGIVTELLIPLAPRNEWRQSIISFDRPHFEDSLLFADALARHDGIGKRLIAPMEWPIPSFFTPLSKCLETDAHAVLIETNEADLDTLHQLAALYGGRMTHTIPPENYRKGVGLSDFTWNHTTLWGLKADPAITYIQAGFSPERFMEQKRLIKAKFGDEVLLHFEWMRGGGRVVPGSIPLIRYTNEERLYEIIHYFESIGVSVSDPHIWSLKAGAGARPSMQQQKLVNDPLGLLNPGKIEMDL